MRAARLGFFVAFAAAASGCFASLDYLDSGPLLGDDGGPLPVGETGPLGDGGLPSDSALEAPSGDETGVLPLADGAVPDGDGGTRPHPDAGPDAAPASVCRPADLFCDTFDSITTRPYQWTSLVGVTGLGTPADAPSPPNVFTAMATASDVSYGKFASTAPYLDVVAEFDISFSSSCAASVGESTTVAQLSASVSNGGGELRFGLSGGGVLGGISKFQWTVWEQAIAPATPNSWSHVVMGYDNGGAVSVTVSGTDSATFPKQASGLGGSYTSIGLALGEPEQVGLGSCTLTTSFDNVRVNAKHGP